MSLFRELLTVSIFFTGVLISIVLGVLSGADIDNTKILAILIAGGIIIGGAFVCIYKEGL